MKVALKYRAKHFARCNKFNDFVSYQRITLPRINHIARMLPTKDGTISHTTTALNCNTGKKSINYKMRIFPLLHNL